MKTNPQKMFDKTKSGFVWMMMASCVFFSNCRQETTREQEQPVFEWMDPSVTGIDFTNKLNPTPEMNIITYLYYYNGGGVAAGDLNGDDLPDLYFTANQQPNRLYLNQGHLNFKDITAESGVEGGSGWTTGVNMADVNGDGLLDIYVCQLGHHASYRGKNQLFINLGNNETGIPTFEDQAEQWGLDLVGYATQSAFFDYDLDGDLDMYMLQHSVHANETFGTRASFQGTKHPTAGDRFLRNEGNYFTDVTSESGINSSAIGYGLGMTVADINLDGYPDLYIGNDFHENDYLYLNNRDGSFREALTQAIGHTSRFSMGTDIADFNNDGLPDIISVDMLPEDPVILKASASEDPLDIFQFKLNYGYSNQFARNTLQLGAGIFPNELGQANVRFKEIGCFAGIQATDWSWSALFFDFDLDGRKDLFVSNGIQRRPNDLDYVKFISADSIQYRLQQEESISERDLKLVEYMPQIKLANYFYKNNGDLTFTNQAEPWRLSQTTFSHGAAYADLDNDGDLDLVVNNTDDPASIYRNTTTDQKSVLDSVRNYLKIKFLGNGKNRFGIGTKVIVHTINGQLSQENFVVRGFQSSVEPNMIIGIGALQKVDSIWVIWPTGEYQTLFNVPANQTLSIDQNEAKHLFDYTKLRPVKQNQVIFEDITKTTGIEFRHKENRFIEFNRERLIPHMTSAEGPEISVGDVNGDGLDDFFIGGAKKQAGRLFVQSKDGKFIPKNVAALSVDSLNEDVAAVFFDVDLDADLDLVVLSGGSEYYLNDPAMQVRLYLNDGKGDFVKSENAFGGLAVNGACLAIADYDKDGDSDLFIGARSQPWHYGRMPKNHLLENNGKGQFSDVIDHKAPGLDSLGLIREATWTDMNNDGSLDLVVIGEWMPISIFLNENGHLKQSNIAGSGLEKSHGWWTTLSTADFDSDGDLDILAGNFGWNSRLRTSVDQPVSLYVDDFDQNGSTDQLLCHYYHGKKTLFATKDELMAQLPALKKKYLKYREFAKAGLTDIIDTKSLRNGDELIAYTFSSMYFENQGGGKFTTQELPVEVQLSVVQKFLIADFNKDGHLDAFSVGNFYEVTPELGRYDADDGTLLLGDGKGSFIAQTAKDTGLIIDGQCRDLKWLKTADGALLLISKNNGPLQVLKLTSLKI